MGIKLNLKIILLFKSVCLSFFSNYSYHALYEQEYDWSMKIIQNILNYTQFNFICNAVSWVL